MKKQLIQVPERLFEKIKSHEDLLVHILSPVELAAYNNSFKSFTYQFGSLPIPLNSEVLEDLRYHVTYKIRLFRFIIRETGQQIISDTHDLKDFLNSSIIDHDLPTYLVNKLRRIECETITDVLVYGRIAIARCRGIGRGSLSRLDRLFAKHNVSRLFQ